MKKKIEHIAQYPLVDEHGNHVQFLLEDWGEMHEFSYDHLKAHRHDFYEILFFEKGKAKHDIDFTSHLASGGNIHFVAPDNVHLLLREKHSQGFSIQFAHGFFPYDLIKKLPFNAPQPVIKIGTGDLKKLLFITNQIRIEVKEKRDFSEKLVYSYFQSLLYLLIRSSKQDTRVQKSKSQTSYIDNFRSLIRAHFTAHYSVEQYASLLCISTKHLIEICKEHTGKTPLKLIQEIVVSEAKRQLFHTDKSIKEVAYALGFDDPSNFSKYFKSSCGFSPLSYRQESGK